jgi:hypothetical protein
MGKQVFYSLNKTVDLGAGSLSIRTPRFDVRISPRAD